MNSKRRNYIERIRGYLVCYSQAIHSDNTMGYCDENREAQSLFANILNLVFKYSLENADKINGVPNYPAIDLCDKSNSLAIQITADGDSKKIKKTITGFIKHNLFESYSRLVVFIIGEKETYPRVVFDTESKFTFSKEKDIWDLNYLIKGLDQIDDINTLEIIINRLSSFLDPYFNPDRFFDEDIKNSILILKRDIPLIIDTGKWSGIDVPEPNQHIQKRSENYIEETKNPLNNINWNFYKEYMKGSWKHNKIICDFLGNYVNSELLKDYFVIASTINNFYEVNIQNNSSFENVFEKIYDTVNIKYNDNLENKKKIKILLYNMYFNCDIGINLNQNA